MNRLGLDCLNKSLSQVVCHKCSGQKFNLRFEETKSSRVCRACFQLLHMHAEKDAAGKLDTDPEKSNPEQTDPAVLVSRDSVDAPVRPKGLLEVKIKSKSPKIKIYINPLNLE